MFNSIKILLNQVSDLVGDAHATDALIVIPKITVLLDEAEEQVRENIARLEREKCWLCKIWNK